MQVTPKYRKKSQRWVVDTRAKAIKKLGGEKGEERNFKTFEEADQHANEVNAAQGNGGVITSGQSQTIDNAVIALHQRCDQRVKDGKITWKHGENLKNHCAFFSNLQFNGGRFGDVRCADISTADIEDLLIPQVIGRPKTIKEKLASLKQLFDLAHRLGWSSHTNPARQVKLEQSRYGKNAPTKKLSRFCVSEIRDLIEAALANEKIARGTNIIWCDGLALAFAAQTGLRFGEQAALHWDAVDLENGRVKVERVVRKIALKVYEIQDAPKTDAAYRTVFLTPQLVTQLREWKLRSPHNDLVFPTRAGTFHCQSANWYNRVLHPACDKVGIDRIRWHDLRHFFASICLELFGEDLNRVCILMGHKSINTTRELYGHWIDDPERDAIDAEEFGKKLWA